LARLNLTRPRKLLLSLAVVSLSFAACSKSGSSPTPTPSSTATASAGPSSVPSNFASPCAAVNGIVYEPDGGNGRGFHGVQVVHYEDNTGNLCGATAAPSATPASVAFASAVGPIAFAADYSDAIAVLQNASGGFTLAQDIFGVGIGAIVPVGAPYDLSASPTSTPATSASPTATATPPNAPLIADAQSIAILGGSSAAVALTTGTASAGSTSAIVALTSLTNAPPQYGQALPFSGSSYTFKSAPAAPRSIVRVGVSTDAGGNLHIVALARGTQDLLAFNISTVGTGYQFDATADDTTLGTNVVLRGNGQLAFSPTDATRALVGGTTGGAATQLTLVTGLPGKVVSSSTLAMPGIIRSIAVTSNGQFGVIGTDVGIVVVKGVNTASLTPVTAFAPNAAAPSANALAYRDCTGAAAKLTNVSSVGLSAADSRYLVALGTSAAPPACASSFNASVVAVPFDPTTGIQPTPAPSSTASASASPIPTSFVQNNVIAPPAGADYLIVR